ncbi:MAG TPA: TolC family protein [Gammaproteobacteria bacterium]|nr:TolC family protein [Gammaproteobacteria bacterium]
MRKNPFRWSRAVACVVITLSLSAPALAQEPVSPALQALARSLLERHPAALAARAELQRSEAEARAAAQPLYNPELELDYEDATDITKTVGLSQALDWAGKRRARAQAGQESTAAARSRLRAARQTLLGELLQALAGLQGARSAEQVGQRRVELLQDFLDVAARRFEAGDVGSSDVDLARLALAEARMQLASLRAERMAREAELESLVTRPAGGWPRLPVLPALPAQAASAEGVDALLADHPRLRQAEAEAAAARARVTLARRERRADPTLGLRGGKEENDTLVGVTLSIPLFVRNSFRAELEAASAEAGRAESAVADQGRRARAQLRSATARYRLTLAALRDWERSGQPSLEGRTRVLKRLWEAGEIDTTDYLVQLQQTLDTQSSAVELRRSAWQAWSAWLAAAGRTDHWLGLAAD